MFTSHVRTWYDGSSVAFFFFNLNHGMSNLGLLSGV